MYVDEKINRKEGNGFCTFLLSAGGEIYASFKCAGPARETCDGKLTHLGRHRAIQRYLRRNGHQYAVQDFLGRRSLRQFQQICGCERNI